MSSFAEPGRNRLSVAIFLYLLAYLVASFLDVKTTALALQLPAAREGNVFVTSGAAYLTLRAWIITASAGIMLAGCVVFAVRNATRVDGVWLQRPMRSFAALYLNPWSPAAIGKSPLHLLSFAIAFVVLRLMAALNNVVIRLYGFAPIGEPIDWVARRTSPVVGFAVVIVPLFYLLAIALSPLAARMIGSWRVSAE